MPKFHASESVLGPLLSPSEISELKKYLEGFEKEEAPELQEFLDVYPEQVIKSDENLVKNLESKFDKEDTKEQKEEHFYASLLEMITMEFGNTWIPGYFSKATRYDDVANGTDFFIELESENGEIIPLAIDATSSVENAKKKLAKSFQDIEQGEFHKVKYFHSEREDIKGSMEMPRLVAGAPKQEITQLARLYLNHRKASETLKPHLLTSLKEHPFGKQLNQELEDQLRQYIRTLKRNESSSKKPKIDFLEKALGEFENNKIAPTKNKSLGSNSIQITIADFIASLETSS